MIRETFIRAGNRYRQAIVVAAHVSNRLFLPDLLLSLREATYPVWVFIGDASRATPAWTAKIRTCLRSKRNDRIVGVFRNSFLSGIIQAALDLTDAQEFLVLHDTCVVKDLSFVDAAFRRYRGKSVALSPNFLMHMGKFRRETLENATIPFVGTDREDWISETHWLRHYMQMAGQYVLLWDDFVDRQVYEQKYGRRNMVLENRYLRKYKAHWSPGMLEGK